jgi:hypothetical protein
MTGARIHAGLMVDVGILITARKDVQAEEESVMRAFGLAIEVGSKVGGSPAHTRVKLVLGTENVCV